MPQDALPPLTERPEPRADHGLDLPEGMEVHSFRVGRTRVDVWHDFSNRIERGAENTPIDLPPFRRWAYAIGGRPCGHGGSFEFVCNEAEHMLRSDGSGSPVCVNEILPEDALRARAREEARLMAIGTAFPFDFDPAKDDVEGAITLYEMVLAEALDYVRTAPAAFLERMIEASRRDFIERLVARDSAPPSNVIDFPRNEPPRR